MVTNSATHGGLIETDLTAYGAINYSNTKIVNHNKLTISSDGKVIRNENGNELNEKLTYILRGNLDISNSANATVNGKINVSDFINIPAGIEISDLEVLKSYLTVSGTGLSDSNVDYSIVQANSGSNNIRELIITYTLDSANENTMTIKIKLSKYRKEYHQSNFTVYYLVKSNGNITVDTLSAKNTASITYNNNTISDTAVVNVIKEKAYPGLTKKYKGAYGSSTTTMDGVNPKLNEHANENSRLVWTFKAFNDTATNANAITDYTISDVLPVEYEYDNLYSESTDGETKYYPSFTVVKSTGSKTYSAYDGTYIEPTYSTTVVDGKTRNVISWHFTDDEFKLEPGEYIEFLISCKLPETIAKSSVAVNDTYLVINGYYETDSNDDVTTFECKKALHAQDYVIVGSANVTTAYKEVELYEEQQKGYQKASSAETDNNKIKAKVGEDIKYTLNIKNDSPSYVKKLVIIDRLPYVGDKYLSTETTNDSVTITLTNKEVLGELIISKYVLNSKGNAITNVPDAFKGPYYVTVVRKDNGNYIDADGKESNAIKVIQLNAGESVTITKEWVGNQYESSHRPKYITFIIRRTDTKE